MTKPDLTRRIANLIRSGALAAGIAAAPLAAQAKEPVIVPHSPVLEQTEMPRAPAFDGRVAEAYTAENNYCPDDMIENGFAISGSALIERLDAMLADDVKLRVFGTTDLPAIRAQTISFNIGGDDAPLHTGGTTVPVRISYGWNIEKQDEGLLIASAGQDGFLWRNVYMQNVEPRDLDALGADLYDIRKVICTLEEQLVSEGGSTTVVGGSERAPVRPQNKTLIDAAAYDLGSSLAEHAVSGEFTLEDLMARAPVSASDVTGVLIQQTPGTSAIAHVDDRYVIVGALPREAGVHEVAVLYVGAGDTTYRIPITATALEPQVEYRVEVGEAESNRILNEFGPKLADAWQHVEFALGNEDYAIDREFSSEAQMSASESRRGYRQIIYVPGEGILGTYELGSAKFTPVSELSRLERAILNSNLAQSVGAPDGYRDEHGVISGAYDPGESR